MHDMTLKENELNLPLNIRFSHDLASIISKTTGMMAQWFEGPPHKRKVTASSPGRVIPKILKMLPTVFSSGARRMIMELES